MAIRPDITAERLREVLHYNPDTGEWTRKIAASKGGFPAGSKAGTRDPRGYIMLTVEGVQYYSHRLAFLYMTGEWPKGPVDHRDLDKSNCRWANLRLADKSLNGANRGLSRLNKSGKKGVSWCKIMRKWVVQITKNGKAQKRKHFDDIDEAASYYEEQAKKLHGEFARIA